jgi:anaerobic ribonucleoside-triphosphate reductase
MGPRWWQITQTAETTRSENNGESKTPTVFVELLSKLLKLRIDFVGVQNDLSIHQNCKFSLRHSGSR